MTIRLRTATRASACQPPRVRLPRVTTRRAEASAPTRCRELTASWAILPASVLLLSVWTAPAQADPQTFDEALARAAFSAPSLRASALGVDAARAAVPAAGLLPDPRLSVGLDGYPVTGPFAGQFDEDFTMLRIGVEQEVPSRARRRADGFVQRVYNRAPGDVIAAGAPLVDLLIPTWGGAQTEYLAVRRTGNTPLIQAARQRLVLMGMSESLIASVERSGRARNTITISTPTGGVIKTLGVRAGMSVTQGMTLAEINGLATVWVNAAIPEALGSRLRVGQSVEVALTAFPGERFTGRLTALLPELVGDSRTVTGRIEMANRGGRLRPGMFGRITFGGGSTTALLVPTEAVIRTGERDIVMLARPEGRYQPAEVRVGREAGGQTEILAGLREGERIVASGQFLIASEASLSGVTARPIGPTSRPATAAPTGASMAAPASRGRSSQ